MEDTVSGENLTYSEDVNNTIENSMGIEIIIYISNCFIPAQT